MHINIDDYINSLRHEKFRSVIIHHKHYAALVEFFIQSAVNIGGKHLDLQDYFLNDPELTKSIDYFSVLKLKNLLVQVSKGFKVIFITNIDFLLDTWSNTEKKDFALLIEKQWNGFYPENSAILVFGLHTDYWLQQLEISDTKGAPRVRKLNEFKAIS